MKKVQRDRTHKEAKKCATCGAEYWVRGRQKRLKSKTCSKKCRVGKYAANWNGGKKLNSQGYVLVHFQSHPFADASGYIREHRLVMEKKIGRYLALAETVHHKNEIKTDNRLRNLQLMTHEEHNALHRAERTKRATKTKKCATCNEEFAFLPRGRRTGKSAPKYCTATCYYISKR